MARLIRGFGAAAVRPRVVIDADAKAARIVAEAEARARAIIANAEQEAGAVRAAAEAAGLRDANAAAASSLALAFARRDGALAGARRELVALAVAIARRIVGDALAEEPTRAATFAAEAIERARGASAIRVRVCPADAPALAGLATSSGVPLTVEADASLAPGDCMVHSDVGTIDARLETKLEAFREALLRELERALE